MVLGVKRTCVKVQNTKDTKSDKDIKGSYSLLPGATLWTGQV